MEICEKKMNYTPPTVEIFEVEIEKGFANSPNGNINDLDEEIWG